MDERRGPKGPRFNIMMTNQILQKFAQSAFEDEMQKYALVGKGKLPKVLKRIMGDLATPLERSNKIHSGDIGFPDLDNWGGFGMNLRWSAKKELPIAPGKHMLQKLQQSKTYIGDVRNSILKAKNIRRTSYDPYKHSRLNPIIIPRFTGPGSDRRIAPRQISGLVTG